MAAAARVNFFWDRLVPTIYSAGAAVVVLGAMAKIQHITELSWLLTVGLIVEAVIFGLYALQSFFFPVASTDYEWERVHPELAADYKGERRAPAPQANGLTAGLDTALAQAKLTPEVFDRLGTGFRSLTETASKMRDLTDATVATSEYTQNVRSAAQSIGKVNESYGTAISALTSLADTANDSKEYREQLQKVTKNVGALNAVYELELQDTNKHLKAVNAFYNSLSDTLQNVTEASRDAQQFKTEMGKLTSNLASLNNVYGSMLTAMRGSVQ